MNIAPKPPISFDQESALTVIHPLPTSPELASVAQRWLRQGYQLVYADGHLVQLTRKGMPPRRLIILGSLLGLALASTVVGLAILALRSRSWHVISLTRGPTDKVITHLQWDDAPPLR